MLKGPGPGWEEIFPFGIAYASFMLKTTFLDDPIGSLENGHLPKQYCNIV